MPPKNKDYYTISELAEELDISTRTIRYYEEIGLLSPQRTPGNHRIFTKKDRARLKIILRGKRLGFTLEEIKQILDMYEVSEPEQIRLTLKLADEKLKQIEDRLHDLKILKEELLDLIERLSRRLNELESTKGDSGVRSET
ncbi:putative transcriptional regulator [Geoglobus ahangari]|uniref:Putative transcriptional regulator n=1 Tax=Geoglobus ahangari TaxID=113653 RepID=A0A0F7IF21_9EURY|nr:MerR family DNA-binding transcriptional regulator [Geoglobus ahangari]AKG91628.1 putative transcriptional regulator [Geoglobus ahangari]